jgi:hypothetical protein
LARNSYVWCGQTCHDARTTGDMENPLARIERRLFNKKRRPLSKDAGYQMALVDLWRVSPKLPSFPFIFVCFHGTWMLRPWATAGNNERSVHLLRQLPDGDPR